MATSTKKPSAKTKKTNAKTKAAARKTTKKAASTKAKTTKRAVKKSQATKAKASAATKPSVKKESLGVFDKLRSWNRGLVLLHGGQAIAMAYLAKDFRVPVDVSFLTFNEATESLDTASRTIADVPLAWILIAFLAMSAVAHAIIAGPWFNNYVSDLKQGINRARWIEYGVSASTMMVAIALLVGINSLALLVSIFMFTLLMNWTGYTMEMLNKGKEKDSVSWGQFVLGSVAGIIPWVIIAMYFVSNWLYGNGNPPTFVYAIFLTIFFFFNTFAINMYLQYTKKGKWSDYLYGEKTYMVLSLVAKSALAWQVFAGTLRP